MRIPTSHSGSASVILAGTPPADGCMSMDLYARDVSAAFERVLPSLDYVLLQPGRGREPWHRKQCLRYFGYPNLLRREIAKRGARVVHVLEQSSAHLCRVTANSVVTCHDIADLKISDINFIQIELWKWRVGCLQRAARVIAISHNTARDLTELLSIPPGRIVVNPSGVPTGFKRSDLPPESPCAKRLLRLRPNRFLFLHVGSNIVRKNIPALLRAFSFVKRSHPEAMLVKVGDPFSRSEYRGMIQELGIADGLIELGRISDEELVEVYRSVDCLVFPSLYEGFGRPVIEAQACGAPCILARSSSLEEVGGDAALYHDPSSAEDLAKQMGRIVAGEPLAADLRNRGYSNAARFTWDNHVRTLLNVYSEVTAEFGSELVQTV